MDVFGGQLVVRHDLNASTHAITTYLDYVPIPTTEETGAQEVVFGKNLLDIDQFTDTSELYTRIYPYGKDGITLSAPIIDTAAEATYGVSILRCPTVEDADSAQKLSTMAAAMLQEAVAEALTVSVSAVDLHYVDDNITPFVCGKAYRVKSWRHENFDAVLPCTRAEINLEDIALNK